MASFGVRSISALSSNGSFSISPSRVRVVASVGVRVVAFVAVRSVSSA